MKTREELAVILLNNGCTLEEVIELLKPDVQEPMYIPMLPSYPWPHWGMPSPIPWWQSPYLPTLTITENTCEFKVLS